MPTLVTIYNYFNGPSVGSRSIIYSTSYNLNSLGVTNITELSSFCELYLQDSNVIPYTSLATASVGATMASVGSSGNTDSQTDTSYVKCTDINLIGGDWIATTVVQYENGATTTTNNVNLGNGAALFLDASAYATYAGDNTITQRFIL